MDIIGFPFLSNSCHGSLKRAVAVSFGCSCSPGTASARIIAAADDKEICIDEFGHEPYLRGELGHMRDDAWRSPGVRVCDCWKVYAHGEGHLRRCFLFQLTFCSFSGSGSSPLGSLRKRHLLLCGNDPLPFYACGS